MSTFVAAENKRVHEIEDFCNFVIPSEDTKILKVNQCLKSNKTPITIYVERKCSIEKMMNIKVILTIHQQQK